MAILGNNKSMLTIIKRMLHTSVSLLNLSTALWALYLPYSVPEKYLHHELMVHMWPLRWYFLSLWVGAFQFIYFGIYSAIDVVEIYGKRSVYHKILDYLHNIGSYLLFTLVFPLSLLTSILFWFFYLWDREIIYPTECDDFIPPFFNHVLHTTPVPLTIIYMLLSNKNEPSISLTLPGLTAFLSIYAYFFFNIRLTQGVWVYVVLHKITEEQLHYLLSFAVIAPFVFFFLGYKLNSLKESIV
ncbi:hypothetical protein O3M35_008892 [Rhynocoris fuscipes]|uniref:Androgen-dependent TFPI-regulating protein n=1 Tax=Rhynocoris fuscipes TaxID=488301 RepID=A0AAW1DEV5_9HEMI